MAKKTVPTKNEPMRISQKRLVKIFKDIKRLDSEEIRFCFLIGAGASKSSGIKTGGELSQEWFEDIKEDLTEPEFEAWKASINLDMERLSEFYPQLYRKRYEASPQIGYDEFKRIMEKAEPGLGYVILSQILAYEKHNFVITTNFDYLIEDAVRMYTTTKPFSAGHETLAEFISSQTERPTIIKVHRDLFLHPFNDDDETDQLKEEWENALRPILKNFNLLVLGYGGNDGSLMEYLKNIDAKYRKQIYWCIRSDHTINSKIRDLLVESDYIVKIDSFDALMYGLHEVLGYDTFDQVDTPKKHPFVKSAMKRIEDLNDKLKELLERLRDKDEIISSEAKSLFTGANKVIYEAFQEKNNDKAQVIFEKGLENYSSDPDFNFQFAIFLEDRIKDYDLAKKYYEEAININPKNATHLADYALFLHEKNLDSNVAEEYYQKALKIDSKNPRILGNYAIFQKNIRNNYDEAQELYKESLEYNPNDASNLGNYALFLYTIRKDFDKAEEFYKKSMDNNTTDPHIIGNYANFLKKIRDDNEKAEEYYLKSLEIEPEHSINLNNYAMFLQNSKKDYSKASEYYEKSLKIDPNQVNSLANYAQTLLLTSSNKIAVEPIIDRAMSLIKDKPETDINAELWFYRFAHFPEYYDEAEKELKLLIENRIRAIGWDFSGNIEKAEKEKHPKLDKLKEFARILTEDSVDKKT